MKTTLNWQGAMTFEATARGHSYLLDTPDLGGKDKGPSPKEMLIAAALGCAGMDVVSLLRKNRITLKAFSLTGNAESRDRHPRIFPQIDVVFELQVEMTDAERELPLVVGAVELSMTKYCGVSAMIAPTSPLFYSVVVNGEIEGRGQADYSAV